MVPLAASVMELRLVRDEAEAILAEVPIARLEAGRASVAKGGSDTR